MTNEICAAACSLVERFAESNRPERTPSLLPVKVCDHPALLSDQAARLVMRGGSRLAAGGPRRSYDSDSDADSGADSEDFISCSSGDEADAQGPRAGGSRGRGGPQDPGAAGEDWWTWAGDDIQVRPACPFSPPPRRAT